MSTPLEDIHNPPFQFLRQRTGIDTTRLSEVSDFLRKLAREAARGFCAKCEKEHDGTWDLPAIKTSAGLEHFFFDLFAVQFASKPVSAYVVGTDGAAHVDAYSSALDGLHYRHYGQPSHEVAETILDLWATRQQCYLVTFLKKGSGEEQMRVISGCLWFALGERGGLMASQYLTTMLLSQLTFLRERVDVAAKISRILGSK